MMFNVLCMMYDIKGLERDVFIDGLKMRNRAFHNDTVIVQIFTDKRKWKLLRDDDDKVCDVCCIMYAV